jgi:hypothetical protein
LAAADHGVGAGALMSLVTTQNVVSLSPPALYCRGEPNAPIQAERYLRPALGSPSMEVTITTGWLRRCEPPCLLSRFYIRNQPGGTDERPSRCEGKAGCLVTDEIL